MDPLSQDPLELSGLGAVLREARLAQGLSLEEMAQSLHWPAPLLEAVESEDWSRIPPGQERPMVRQMATFLACDLEHHGEAFARVPGELPEEGADPRLSRLERHATLILALGFLAALGWLLKPGSGLRSQAPGPTRPMAQRAWMAGERPKQPYPVLGEAIPEAPVTEEGILVYLRVQDICHAKIQSPTGETQHEIRPETPWQGRVKGPFQLELDNAGIVVVHVAGRRIAHGRAVGETWTGNFDAQGLWLHPPTPATLTPGTSLPEEPGDPEDPEE